MEGLWGDAFAMLKSFQLPMVLSPAICHAQSREFLGLFEKTQNAFSEYQDLARDISGPERLSFRHDRWQGAHELRCHAMAVCLGLFATLPFPESDHLPLSRETSARELYCFSEEIDVWLNGAKTVLPVS